MARDTDLGRPDESIKVTVETNIDVVNSLDSVVGGLIEVVEEQKKTQTVLSFILGEEVDLD